MLLLYGAEERRWTNSNLQVSPLVLQVSFYCLYPKQEITSPASFDIKYFDSKIMLALVLPGEAKGSKTLDLQKVEVFLQEVYNSIIPKGSPGEGFCRDMQPMAIMLFGVFKAH